MILTFRQNITRAVNLLVLCGSLVVFLGLLALIGWFLHIGIFTSFLPYYITMKFNTALCFVLLGTAFLLLVKYNAPAVKILVNALALGVSAFAFTSLTQDIFHWQAGIDQLFVTDYDFIKRGLANPGRMSPSTALCFTLLGIAFVGMDARKTSYRAVAQYLFHVVTLLSFTSIVGFILKLSYTAKFSFFSSMAFNTATCFFVLSVGAASINYTLGITSMFSGDEIGNVLARKLFPRMVVILIALGYLSIECQRHGYISAEFGSVVSTISFLLIGLFLIKNALNEMNRIDQKRNEAEGETQMLNRHLEDIVKQRTLELEHSNDRFRKILNANPICMAVTNIETGLYTDINPALLELLKYDEEDVIGQTAASLGIITTEYRQKMVDSLATTGHIKNIDMVLKDKYKNDKYVLLTAELLETVEGRFMMSFVYDITNRIEMENSILESKKSLEVLTDKLTNQNKQLLSFAHIISHNLRSPVANLNLLSHLHKDAKTEEDKDDLWNNFETVIGHLNTTLDDLLETLRIQEDTGKEREKLSFEKIYKSISEVLIGQMMESSAIITVDFKKSEFVEYPKMYLESILLNLVSNAIKYRSPFRRPEIRIESDNIDGQIILTVQDNGLGINLHRHQKSLFGLRKTFHRHAEAKGLGLFITKTQIEAMGGEISAQSIVDVGTTFKVIFNKIQL